MSETIERYLNDLRSQLAGSDPATVQDAVADAEEHLRSALDQARHDGSGKSDAEILEPVLREYGSPEEVAKAYAALENQFIPAFGAPRVQAPRNPLQRFVGVLGDPRAYAALFFMLFSLITGIIYFAWAVTGMSLSLGLIVLIFGLPFFGLFVFSIQGLALVEGRLIETLLGIRMPRRAAGARSGKGLWGKFWARVKDYRTWTTWFYLVLKLPLGVLSFSVFIVFLAYSLQLILIPVLQYIMGWPFFVIDDISFRAPLWLVPVLMLAGFLDLIVVLHFARFVGRGYGAMAKAMLVRG